MTYTINIIKDKYATTEKEIYKGIINNDVNIKLIIKIIKRLDKLEYIIDNYN